MPYSLQKENPVGTNVMAQIERKLLIAGELLES